MEQKKSLGQHWLRDEKILQEIADLLEISENDTVVEIGPGKGVLTKYLVGSAKKVIAVELDEVLAARLCERSEAIQPGSRRHCVPRDDGRNFSEVRPLKSEFYVINEDFLEFDLESLPVGYKIVGNIPYYITGKIVQKCLSARNKPKSVVLLVQKEVAERISAPVGKLSILGVLSQFYADVSLGPIATADKFDPPPKVDSQVVVLKPRAVIARSASDEAIQSGSLRSARDDASFEKEFIKVVKAGFSAKRKKLKTSLAGGLGISKDEAEKMLKSANIDPNLRAQELLIDDWKRLTYAIIKI